MKRLTPAFLTLLMFGVVGLLVAAYVAKNLLASPEKKVVNTNRTLPMAGADIEPGTLITKEMLGNGYHPGDKLERDMLLADRVIVGRYAKTKIKAAVPIRTGNLFAHGDKPALDVTPGMRAVTIDVGDATSLVNGQVRPAGYVDLLFTVQGGSFYAGNGDDTLQGGLTLKLFEGVKVLEVNGSQTQSRVERTGNKVTLELTENQANIVTLAAARGKISLNLNPNGRGTGGLVVTGRDRVTLNEILGLKPATPEAEPFLTENYRGVGRSVNRFNEKGRLIDSNSPLPSGNNRTRMTIPSNNPPAGSAPTNTSPASPNYLPAADGQRSETSPTAARELSIPN